MLHISCVTVVLQYFAKSNVLYGLSIMKVVNQNPVEGLYLISLIGFNDCKLFRYSPPNRIEEG